MAATIIQRVISGTPDNAIQLSNAQFGRQVTLPDWSKVRVGVRMHITDPGANFTPHLYIGLGHGTTNMVGDATCDNWIGLYTNASWTRYGGPPPYFRAVNALFVAKKVAAVLTTAGLIGSSFIGAGAALASADRVIFFVDITKGAPNYTVNVWTQTATPITDQSAATFSADMILAVPVILNYAFGTAQAIAFNEAPGALNAVQIFWDRSDSLFEILDLAVSVLA